MSHGVLIIRHSGSGVLCNSSQASQYGHSDVAATAIPGGHFVFAGDSLWHLATAGLSLSLRSPEQPPAAPSPGAKGSLYGQSAPSIDSGGAVVASNTNPSVSSWPSRCNTGWNKTFRMAENKTRRHLQCFLQYRPDRHVSAKLAQVYQLLAPASASEAQELKTQIYEQDSSHLCASLLRSAEGAEDHQQSNSRPAGVCADSPINCSTGMGL